MSPLILTLHYLSLAAALLSLCWHGAKAAKTANLGHWTFAIFSGSLAFVLLRNMGNNQLGAYQYLLAIGGCASCNMFWLVARTLFRSHDAVRLGHILFASIIAVLVIAGAALRFAYAQAWLSEPSFQMLIGVLGAMLGLLSSTVLVLSFWEGLREWSDSQGAERLLRNVFLGAYGGCVLASQVAPEVVLDAGAQAHLKALVVASCSIVMLIVGHVLVCYRAHHPLPRLAPDHTNLPTNESIEHAISSAYVANADDERLAARLEEGMKTQRWFLQSELKIAELAQRLDVPEYKLTRAISAVLKQKNFNQYVNRYRIEHAKLLLSANAHRHWPILVIGLESGFASLGPFNRAFKSLVGATPSEFRSKVLGACDSAKALFGN